MPGLKTVTSEDRLIVRVERLRHECDLIIAEYKASKKPEPRRKKKIKIEDPFSGRTAIV